MVRIESIWSSARPLCSSTSIMPMTPFMGVRISWLMVARKADLARLASSAPTLATSSSRIGPG